MKSTLGKEEAVLLARGLRWVKQTEDNLQTGIKINK